MLQGGVAYNPGIVAAFRQEFGDRLTVSPCFSISGAHGAALLALEYQKGRPVQRQLQLVGAAEAFHLLFVLLTVYGGMAGLSFWANLLWVLLACARGWAALSLYKMQEDDA